MIKTGRVNCILCMSQLRLVSISDVPFERKGGHVKCKITLTLYLDTMSNVTIDPANGVWTK